jgi:hypothetical protein
MAFEIPTPLVSVFNKVTSTAAGCGFTGWVTAEIAMNLSYRCKAPNLANNIGQYGVPTLIFGGLMYSLYNQFDKYTCLASVGSGLFSAYNQWDLYSNCMKKGANTTELNMINASSLYIIAIKALEGAIIAEMFYVSR